MDRDGMGGRENTFRSANGQRPSREHIIFLARWLPRSGKRNLHNFNAHWSD
jgi:hypothetical protein